MGVNFPPMHPWCRCTFVPVYAGSSSEKAKYFQKSGLTSEGEGGIIGIYRKKENQTGEDTYLTDVQFSNLTIEVRKLGAAVVRNDPQFNKRLAENDASAATYGDVLVFGENVTKSDVLEETFHYKQNLNKVNDDKLGKLRTILNEIEAKQYLLDNAKKYSIPRSETELTKKQLASYQRQLEEYEGE